MGWFAGHRRLTIRYERQIDHSLRAVNCQLRSPITASPRWRIESANGVHSCPPALGELPALGDIHLAVGGAQRMGLTREGTPQPSLSRFDWISR